MGKVSLGEQIKKLRTSKKMTLSVMAERTGVTISTISAYENETRTPSLDVLVKIAKLFNVTTDNLLGYSNKDYIDVSSLTLDQRIKVEEMVLLYEKFNKLIMVSFDIEGFEENRDELNLLFNSSMESFEKNLDKI